MRKFLNFQLLVGSIFIVGCRTEVRKNVRSVESSPVRVQLSLIDKKTTTGLDLSAVEVILEVQNPSKFDIRLDRRFLAPVVGIDIRNPTELVPNMPTSIPRPFSTNDVILLNPGSERRSAFELRDVTFHSFGSNEYTVVFVYDSSEKVYPVGSGMFKGNLISNTLRFVRKEDSWCLLD